MSWDKILVIAIAEMQVRSYWELGDKLSLKRLLSFISVHFGKGDTHGGCVGLCRKHLGSNWCTILNNMKNLTNRSSELT